MAQRRGQAPIADPLDNLIAGIDRTLAPPPAPRAVAPPADLDALIGSIDQLLAPPARPRGLNAGGTFTGPVRVTEPPGAIPPPPAVPETFTPRPPVTPAPDVRDLTILGRMAKGYGADVQAQERQRLRAEAQRKAAQRALPPAVATLQKATSIGPAPPREPSVLQRSLAAAARVNPLIGGIEAAANVVPALSGAFHALPTAIGEQIAGQDLPGHQGEAVAGPVPTERGSLAYGSGQEIVTRHPLVERLLSHAKMILSGEGGGVQPIGLVRATTNPPDTAVATEPGTLAYGSGQTAVTRGRIGQIAVETGRRGLDLVAQLLTDPTTVAAMGVRGEAGDLLAAAFTVDGVTTAARVAHDPKSTPEDVAEATLGAAIMAVPMAARHGVPKLREYVHAAAERARTADAARVADQALGYQGPEFAKPVGQGVSEGVVGRRSAEPPTAGTPVTPRTPPPVPPTPEALVAQIDQVLGPENVRVPELGPDAVTPTIYPGPERRHAARIATPEADARYQQMREKIARGERTGTEEARADFAERQRVEAERQRLAEAAAVRDLEQATPEDLVDHIDTVLQEGGHASTEPSYAESRGDRGTSPGAVVREEPQPPAHVETAAPRLREHPGEGVAPARREDADHPQGEAVVTLSEISASVQEAAVGGANDMRGSSDGVPQSMRTRRLDREVVDPIIGAIPVDVVNVLGGEQRSTEALLHNPAVFARLLTAVPNVDVPTLAGSLGTVIADRRAELSGPRSGRGSAEYSAALEAFDRHLREAVARSTTPEATAAVLPRESLPVTTPRTEAPASSPDLTRINQEGVVTVPTGTTDLHDISLPRPSTAATQERPTRKVKPPKPTGDAATWVGPQQIGGRYRSGYWGKEYTVESIARDARGAPKSMTIRWEDGDVTTHQTAWDRKRDKVIQQPEAPAGEVQKTPLPPSTEILKGQTPVTTKETPRISPSVPPSIGGLLERKEAEVTPSGKMSPTVTPSRGPGNISTPQNPPEPEGGTSQEGVAPSGIYYFHGTTQKYLPRILKRGLQVQKAGANWSQSQQQAYVTDNRFDARTWAHEASRRTGSVLADTPIVLKLDIPDADIARLERDFSSDAYGRFSLPDDIPSKWIVGYSVRQADGTWSDIEVRHKKQRPNLSGSPQRGESALSPTASTPKARLQIRQGEYRDKPGFHITGKDAKGHPVQIFTETRESAEHIKAKLQRGEDTTVEDFDVGKAKAGGPIGHKRTERTGPPSPKTRSGGGNVSAMAAPPPPIPPPPPSRTPLTGRPQMRPAEIVKALHEGFEKLPISTGHFRQRAVGIFKQNERAVRTRVANDLPTIFHEVGHFLDISLLGIKRKDARWKHELVALGTPTSRPSYTLAQQRQEGAAEFFRLYLLEPAEAKRHAPAYFAEFERTLALPEHAEAAAVVRDVQQRVEGYLSQDLATRGAMRIDTTGGGPSMPTPRDLVGALSRAWIDDLQAIRDAVEAMRDGRDLPFAKNAYVLARISRGSAAKAEAFLEHGVRARNGQFVGPSFADAIAPVRHALEDFGQYLVSLRVQELAQRNIETGITSAEAAALIRKAQTRPDFAEFERARDNVYAYQDATLDYARQYKAMSPEQIAAIKKLNQFYVPFQRVKDAGQARTLRARKYANRTVPIKRIHGSGLDIVNPFESIIRNTFAIVDMVEKNRAMLALTEQAAASAGSARWLERVNPVEAQRVLVGRALDAMNPDARELLEAEGLDVDRLVTVFNPRQTPLPSQHIVTVIRNGKPEFWQIHDEDLYDAVTAIGPRMTSTLMEWAEKPVRLLRAGATLTPGFIARNPTRGALVAFMQSRYGFIPGLDTVRGVFGILLHDPDAILFDTSGVRQAALVGADTDRRRARQAISHLTARSKAELARRIIFHPIDLLRMVSEVMEAGTRLGEFKLALEAGGQERGIVQRLTEGNRRTVNEETLVQATLAARDVTTDFSRGGSVSREMNRFWAFFNARVQGYVRMFESAKRAPGGTAAKLLGLALVSWFLWWLNEDDDEYHNLEEWERNSYWHVRVGKKFAKIAKPFEWGYLPNVIEAGLDYLRRKQKDGDAHAAKALDRVRPDKDSARKAVFGLMPSAIAPALEAAFNYATFRDQYIVQPWNLGLDPELQYSEWTTETAKGLGALMGVSPAKIDHVVFGYTAGFGRGVVEWGSDPLLRRAGLAPTKNPPAVPSQRQPLVGVFVREAAYSSSSQDIEDFYDQYEAMQGYQASVTRYLKAGDRARAETRKAQAAKEPFFTHSAEIKAAAAAFKDVGKEIDRIYKAPPAEMTPQQKRETLDRVYERMVDIARKALGRPGLKAAAGRTPVTATGTR
jgi:hypothetical protein